MPTARAPGARPAADRRARADQPGEARRATARLMAGRAYDESTLLGLADAYQRAIGLNERPLEKNLAEKDQLLKNE
jgi:hypothetical protein